ncbi:lymphocyte antigen 6A-2/6E-1-like [Arvicanthis niloticus]|uniref:lymphocyte antigen 6A-2/6E-1-like n=1 Tax=Arvicanthis niloticus TaxID=61156 RepID=UPI001486942A|nr:lymphocyte antigen 6A-2/6E-1-like [Arvicanthis niloticus]
MNSSHTTKSCVFILLVALLCAERAQGLECYHCLGVPLDASCPSVTCIYPNGVCITHKIEVIFSSQRSKQKSSFCLPDCPATFENGSTTINVTTFCCKKDLCNAAIPTGGRTWTMAGVLLFSLGSVLLQTLL